MITVHWTGKAVSDNAKTLKDSHGKRRNSGEYLAYRASVALTIRAQRPGVRLVRPGLKVQFRLDAAADATNFLKGLLDGIQDSGIIVNDRDIAPVEVERSLRRPRGAPDEAWLVFWESER